MNVESFVSDEQSGTVCRLLSLRHLLSRSCSVQTLESDSSSYGSEPQLAPAHELSDDCLSEKTELRSQEEDVSAA